LRIMKNIPSNEISTTAKRTVSLSEMDSLAVIRSIAAEGFKTGWKAGRKSSNKAAIARDRAALMNEQI